MSIQVMLLRDKLDALTKQQMEFVESKGILDKCLMKAKKMVDDFDTSESKSATTSIKIALFLESLEENLRICQNTFKSMKDYNTDSVDFIANMDTNNLNEDRRAAVVQENTAITFLQSQVEKLQVDIFNLQETNNKKVIDKIQQMETEIFLMKESNQSDNSNLNARLQNVEVKQLLIDEIHVKDSETIKKNNAEMSKLRIDIVTLQDQLGRADAWKADVQKQTEKMKVELETLIKLRDLLNQKNKHVESRAELTETVSQLREEMVQLQMSFLQTNSVDPEDKKSDVMPAFSANISSTIFILPGKKLTFSDVSLNKWGCYSQTEGVFQAPVSGIYVFFVSVNADSRGGLCIAIVHNNNSVALSSTCGRKDSQTSTSALLELDDGDKVWIEADRQTDANGIRIGSGFSNFIGFRVQ